MPTFLSLPLEIRFQIYRETQSPAPTPARIHDSDRSDHEFLPAFKLSKRLINTGYWDYKFPALLLLVNRQICAEAKAIFYGENSLVFVASPANARRTFLPDFTLSYLRKVHIRYEMDMSILVLQTLLTGAPHSPAVLHVTEFVNFIARNKSIQSCQISWVERSSEAGPNKRTSFAPMKEARLEHAEIAEYLRHHPGMTPHLRDYFWDQLEFAQTIFPGFLQPLGGIPRTCALLKGNIAVEGFGYLVSRALEKAFSNCLDAVVALRESS
ncbi:hypothetical protein MMC28_004511 [Mycoblastus sanguinarius]|nr:hypothetical protein [Mycoblastus sanguinarius]